MEAEKKKIKILLVAGRMDVGGIENQLMHLIRFADHSKFQIDFTTTADHPFYKDEILGLGGECLRIPSTKGRKFIRYCKSLYRVMKNSLTTNMFHRKNCITMFGILSGKITTSLI